MAESKNSRAVPGSLETTSASKAETPELCAVLAAMLARYAMLTLGQTVAVGASGGPDSTALLHALAHLRDEWRLSLVACHVNHGFRGAEAEADAEYVRVFCEQLNVPCHIETIDVPAMQKRRHLSAQQAAREVRHAVLRRVAAEVGAERIALAHTRDDRTETVLLNILRGSGLEGLAGFAPVALPLIRPLYDVTRLQVEQYCAHFHLTPRHDSSNSKLTYRRNRIRAELLPQLRAYYNPKADDALLRLADLAQEDNALLDALAAQSLETLAPSSASDNTTGLQLPLTAFNTLPLGLRRRVLRQAITQTRGNLQNVSFDVIQSVLEAAADKRTWSIELPADSGGTLRIRCDGDHVVLLCAVPAALLLPWQNPVVVPGRTLVDGRNIFVEARICPLDALSGILEQLQSDFHMKVQSEPPSASANEWRGQIVGFSLDSIKLPLLVRGWRAGDRMRPRGLGGTKKIQDIFTDIKVPAEQRAYIPLLREAEGRILAAGDLRTDETALFASRLRDKNGMDPQALTDIERNVAARPEVRELLVILLMYHCSKW